MSPRQGPGDRLAPYRAKRAAGETPEPPGGEGLPRPRLFVVQQHAARRLHYDLRLELGGVLVSWAVPKGPSLDPGEKRLAIATEDHPVEYADFEGILPQGSYGAGAMIVWDRGRWIPREDPEEGLEKGKLLFDLEGYKLRGLWTLVRTRRGEGKEWLLIKKTDAWAQQGGGELPRGSVLSGLTVEELARGPGRAEEIRGELERLGAPRRQLRAPEVELMLAELRRRPFRRPGWIFELKYDGYRTLAAREPQGQPLLRYRSGAEATRTFPEIARSLAALPYGPLILDGEVVVLDGEARPSFQRLQKRAQLSRARDIEGAAVELPATFYAFDLLAFEGFDLRPLPLLRRKEILARLLPEAGPLRFADHLEERGEELFAEVRSRGIEGIVAKRGDSPYRGGRSGDWRKIRADREGDFAIVGFTAPKGARTGFGALHLAAFEGPELVYTGRVGAGFSEGQLAEIRGRLEGRRRQEPPCRGPLPRGEEHAWVEPELVARVRFSEVTDSGLLRKPVFLEVRPDKAVRDCVRDGAPPPVAAAPRPEAPPPEVPLTHLDKVFWPEEGYTKGDLVAYYRAVAPWILPYLRDRPVVLDRYPDGIGGKSFFQKNAAEHTPGWVRTAALWSGDSGREIDYFVCDGAETLLYLANLAAIPLHIWASRLERPERPDWSILDLDAKEAPFQDAVRVARALHDLCREIGLPSFVKTSGASGLHVLIPLAGAATYEQSRQLADILALLVARDLPAIATVERSLAARRGRVYIDCVQNGAGRLLVAPYSVRPLPGAPVSTPLEWLEVRPALDPGRFTIASVPRRLRAKKADPLRPVLEVRPDLTAALSRLAERL